MAKYDKNRLFEMMSRVGGMPSLLLENELPLLREFEVINEIDFEKLFSDLKDRVTCVPPESFKEYLNLILKRKSIKDYSKKPPLPINKPWIHPSTIHMKGDPRMIKVKGPSGTKGGKWAELKFRDVGSLNLSGEEYDEIMQELGEFDIERFIKEIVQKPINIVDANDKMEKSSTETSITYNTGLPAFRGLVYDKSKNEFLYINTCPGASMGCIIPCYARKGNYITYPYPYLRATQILNYLLNEPSQFELQLMGELENICKMHGNDIKVYMRWNDAGDFFSNEYFRIAENITDKLIEKGYNVGSYGYTKVAKVYERQNPNFLFTFSTNSRPSQIQYLKDRGLWKNAKTSDILKKEYFDDLLLKEKKAGNRNVYALTKDKKVQFIQGWDGVKELKRRIAQDAFPEYKIEPESILTYNQLLSIKPEKGVIWNAVIMPTGDGDVAAQREDVRKIFLCEH